MTTWYVFRTSGKALGTLQAEDSRGAETLAAAMHGRPVVVFPRSHTSQSERLLCDLADGVAEGGGVWCPPPPGEEP